MRLNLNEFLTDEDIHTLWAIAGRVIDSGAIMDDQDYEISLSLLTEDPKSYDDNYLSSLSEGYDTKVDALVDSMGMTEKEVSTSHRRKDLDLL